MVLHYTERKAPKKSQLTKEKEEFGLIIMEMVISVARLFSVRVMLGWLGAHLCLTLSGDVFAELSLVCMITGKNRRVVYFPWGIGSFSPPLKAEALSFQFLTDLSTGFMIL